MKSDARGVRIAWGIWVLSALPLAVLLTEFRTPFCGQTDGWFFAKFYSHFFIYPVSFGLIAMIFLTRPLLHAWNWVVFDSPRWTIALLGGTILVVVLVGALNEFGRATPAVWDFPPSELGTGAGINVRAHVMRLCETAAPLSKLAEDVEGNLRFRDQLGELAYGSRRSWTHSAYVVGFVAQVILLVAAFIVIAVIRLLDDKQKRDEDAQLLSVAVFMSSFWYVLRLIFLQQKLAIYPDDRLEFVNYVIGIAFLGSYVWLVTLFWRNLDQNIEKIVAIGSGLVMLATPLLNFTNPDLLVAGVGSRSEIGNFAVILVAIGLVMLPWGLRLLVMQQGGGAAIRRPKGDDATGRDGPGEGA